MFVKMSEESKAFLVEYLPDVIDCSVPAILESLYNWIDENGFEPPTYHEYNDFGRMAQKVYDDIYWSNKKD